MRPASWTTWLSVLLIAASAGWMTFDGLHALIAGDYITPRSGDFAGQLGPWANLVQAIGLDPRSVWMKLVFVVQGAGTLTVIVQFVLNRPWAQTALLATMLLGLWYLPIGTLINLLALIILLLTRKNPMPPRPRYAMPDFIQNALLKRGLLEAYLARPSYQRNDYIGWIIRAKLPATRQKRLKQMLAELKQGDVYMKMKWNTK
jgi:hypothetical protein